MSLFSLGRSRETKKSIHFIRKEVANLLLLIFGIYIYDQERYHKSKHISPQVVNIHITLQPDKSGRKNTEFTIENLVYQSRIQDQSPK